MERFLAFIQQVPFLCGALDAARESDKIRLIFEFELKNKGSSFAENARDKKNPWNRIAIPFAFALPKGVRVLSKIPFAWLRAALALTPTRYRYASRLRLCRNLVMVKVLSHRIKEHGDTELLKLRETLVKEASLSKDTEVMALYSAEEAMSSWWDEWHG